MHHDKLEEECRQEKTNLIKLAAKFNKTIGVLTKKYNVDFSGIKESNEYKTLKDDYENVDSNIMDIDFFNSIFGKSLLD